MVVKSKGCCLLFCVGGVSKCKRSVCNSLNAKLELKSISQRPMIVEYDTLL